MARGTWQPIRILGKGPWSLLPAQTWSVLTDFVIFAAGLSVFYVILLLGRTWLGPFNPHVEISRDPTKLPMYAAYSLLGRTWLGPFNPHVEISRDPTKLPMYAAYSLLRIAVAYVLSLAFTLVYGYVAAYNPKAERIMIPLLDILQSIPVLSFLPGVMLAMVALIVLLDQIGWRPVIAWAEKFKMEQVESADVPHSWFLNVIQGSRGLIRLRKRVIRPLQERLAMHFVRQHDSAEDALPVLWKVWTGRAIAAIAVVAVLYAVTRAIAMLTGLDGSEYRELLTGAGATFLRVVAALVIGAAWTIPAGVAIGFNPKLARIAQPLAQIAASVPATALFPIVLLVLIRIGGGLGLGSIVLLLLGTQWYILFNVIAGAMAIPTDLKEAANVFGLRGWERWRKLILPGIFPFLVTGLVTASGGAWNASIVAEYFHFKGQ